MILSIPIPCNMAEISLYKYRKTSKITSCSYIFKDLFRWVNMRVKGWVRLMFGEGGLLHCLKIEAGPATPGGPEEPCPPPTPPYLPSFLRSKKKKGRQRQKGKDFKTETIKRLSPRSKYYCFSHSRASRIRKFLLSANHGGRQYFPVFHGPPTLKFISPAQ